MSGPDIPGTVSRRPLAISLLLGVSGWFAGVLLLIFVAVVFSPDKAAAAAIVGALLLAAAWALFAVDTRGEHVFLSQLALALSIAGQCLALYAMGKDAHGIAPVAAAALVLQAVLALVMPNRLHRVLSTLFATIAWALALRFTLFPEPSGWPGGHAAGTASPVAALAGWLLTWVPVAVALGWAIRNGHRWAQRPGADAASAIVTGLIAGLAFATLASEPFDSHDWLGADGAGYLAVWPLLSALSACGALAAAFALSRRGLMALCALAALLHVAHFYYAVGTSLLVKSLMMLGLGGVLIVAGRALRAKEPA
jgi:hypothetical protein